MIINTTKEGKVLRRVHTPLAAAYAETGDTVQVVEPAATPLCSKIPYEMWRQMLAFFAWSQNTNKDEAQISGFLHRTTGAWLLEPFWQEGFGMTTTEIGADDPRQIALWDSLRERGFHDIAFTGHHHCTSSAFQSGTDHNDEIKNKGAGFHITIGHLDKPVYDLHCRAKFVTTGTFDADGKLTSKGWSGMMPFDILDLVQVPIDGTELIRMNKDLRKALSSHYLLAQARTDEAFPEFWKERVLKRSATTMSVYRPGAQYEQSVWTFKKSHIKRGPKEEYPLQDVLSVFEVANDLAGETVYSDEIMKCLVESNGGAMLMEMLHGHGMCIDIEDVDVFQDALMILDEQLCTKPDGYNMPGDFVDALAAEIEAAIHELNEHFAPLPYNKLMNAYTQNRADDIDGLTDLLGTAVGTLDPDLFQKCYDEAWKNMKTAYQTPTKSKATGAMTDAEWSEEQEEAYGRYMGM